MPPPAPSLYSSICNMRLFPSSSAVVYFQIIFCTFFVFLGWRWVSLYRRYIGTPESETHASV